MPTPSSSRGFARMRAVLLAASLAFASSGAFAELRIGVTVGQFDHYIAYLVSAMQDRAKTLPEGATLQVEDSAGDLIRQLGHVENFIAQQVDAIVVNPAATDKITERATQAGIPLVYLNSRPEVQAFPPTVAFVGTDESRIGQMQMEYLAEKMGGKGNIAILLGRLAHDDTRKRTEGVKDVLARYPQIRVVEEQSGDWQRERGMDLMNNWLLVGGIDGTPDGMAAIAHGQMAVTLRRDPQAMGEKALEVAVRLAHREPLQGDIWIPVQLVTPENHAQYTQLQGK